MNYNLKKCRICGLEYEGVILEDPCPLCNWVEGLTETDDEYCCVNHMTALEAKANFAKGLNIWGDPLPNKDN